MMSSFVFDSRHFLFKDLSLFQPFFFRAYQVIHPLQSQTKRIVKWKRKYQVWISKSSLSKQEFCRISSYYWKKFVNPLNSFSSVHVIIGILTGLILGLSISTWLRHSVLCGGSSSSPSCCNLFFSSVDSEDPTGRRSRAGKEEDDDRFPDPCSYEVGF